MTRFGDRYGFYQIGDVKTYSKYEVMDIHHNQPQAWQWNYNDEFFSRYDWTIEPTQSINELYKKRAEQLRRDYDYLIFYYSGGHDSANMLYAFLDNNIHLDEICVFYSKFDSTSLQHKELTLQTWPKLNDLKKQYPKLKIRKFEYGEHILKWHDYIKELGYENNLPSMFGNSFSVNRLILDLAYRYIDDWKKLLERGKKIGWLLGSDKPMLRYHNKQWIFNFHDLTQMLITPMRQLLDDGNIGTYELFYWTPSKECVDILIKQCHLLKKKYKEQAEKDFSKIIGAKNFVPGYGWELDKNDDEFNKIIYPRNFKFTEKFIKIKSTFYIWGYRDEWFYNSHYEGAKIHRDMIDSICNKPHYRSWYNDKTTINYGFRNAMSRDYII
jgi:hypothetical protein